MNARRLAALDMHGRSNTSLRRRLVLGEFVLSAALGFFVGSLLMLLTNGWFGWAFGVWVVGLGVNYVLLAFHAIRLSVPGALDRELEEIDLERELRRYGRRQLWLALPLSLFMALLLQGIRNPQCVRPRRGAGNAVQATSSRHAALSTAPRPGLPVCPIHTRLRACFRGEPDIGRSIVVV